MEELVSFSSGQVRYMFQCSVQALLDEYKARGLVIITDSNIAALYPDLFLWHKTIIIPAGEDSKSMNVIEYVVQQLLKYEANRHTLLIGLGGGVVTDITGFVASTYMRGISFGFVPTSLLAMVDAAIGGKNGINMGLNKNILGTFKMPHFICFDLAFLKTLPIDEWSNGFAEVIKYACIWSEKTFEELTEHDIAYYRNDDVALSDLIKRCIEWKNYIVKKDETEVAGLRMILNFGHTAGHAIENLYDIPHGRAVAIGMVIACQLSEKITGLDPVISHKLCSLLLQYQLPVSMYINPADTMDVLKMDKKRDGNIGSDTIHYICLERIGKPAIVPIKFQDIEKELKEYAGKN